tara:strand:- start:88 stop:528 length:441 start_codon:yes stop_codon:yes gene_type:complete
MSIIFAYRALDLRDRFPGPFPDFRSALEALQSDVSYLPEMSGEIVAYCRDGRSIGIPREFFIREKPRFQSRAAAEQWVRERMAAVERGGRLAGLQGVPLVKSDDPVEQQIEDALTWQDSRLVAPQENDVVCEQVDRWLLEKLETTC